MPVHYNYDELEQARLSLVLLKRKMGIHTAKPSNPPPVAAPPMNDKIQSRNSVDEEDYDSETDPRFENAFEDIGPTVECPDCGRSFQEGSYEKHVKICKKVFMKKRKQFDTRKMRLHGRDDAADTLRKLNEENKKPKPKADPNAVKPWKLKSLELRARVGKNSEEADQELKELSSSTNVSCPHCARTFNQEAAKKHIPICLKTFGGKNTTLKKGSGINASNGGIMRTKKY